MHSQKATQANEVHSFSDLARSKGRAVVALQWLTLPQVPSSMGLNSSICVELAKLVCSVASLGCLERHQAVPPGSIVFHKTCT